MKTKNLHKVLFLFLMMVNAGSVAIAQYDLKAEWNVYEPGITTDDDPFYGSFTISNIGEETIPAGDTIWYGYLINGDLYDKDLNSGLVSGVVLEEDFLSGEEKSIYNLITWPLWGSGDTIEVCATVFGVGVDSYTEDYYTGDEVPENNSTCVEAVLPIYFSDIPMHTVSPEISNIRVNSISQQILLEFENEMNGPLEVSLLDIAGHQVQNDFLSVSNGKKAVLNYPKIPTGIYFVRLAWANGIITKKIFIQ